MGNFAIVLLTEVVILGVVLGARYHGHESYKQYYNNHVSGGQLPMTDFYKESHYGNDVKEEVKYRFEDNSYFANKDGFSNEEQARNDGNSDYASVAYYCDYKTKQTFCENVSNYPQELVNEILVRNSTLIGHAFEDVIAVSPRFDNNNEQPLCLSTEQLIHPKMAVNIKNQWNLILQADNFHQGIRIELCIEPNTKCRLIDDIAVGYETSCKQKFIYREMLALNERNETVQDYFRLPASCCCHVQFKADEERMNPRFF